MKSLIRMLTASAAMLASWPAAAGYWNYGCKGSLGDSALVFDRGTFLIMPKAAANGDIKGIARGEIFSFDADDNNSGFLPVMRFARGAFPDQKIVLTEKASTVISRTEGQAGRRSTETTNMRKTYRYQRLGWTEAPDADVTMECFEYSLSAP